MYAFAEYKELVGMSFYVANKIYTPSYISLHTALAEYGLIPELIVQTTSVSTLKTNRFSNDFGVFSYKSIRPELFFGYEFRPMEDGKTIWFALAEKALLDLMYLYPFYNTEEEFVHLRLDEDSMEHILDRDLFYHFLKKFNSRALNLRAELLLKVYAL
jgi:predicted transcriptional regulator of viral defense system